MNNHSCWHCITASLLQNVMPSHVFHLIQWKIFLCHIVFCFVDLPLSQFTKSAMKTLASFCRY